MAVCLARAVWRERDKPARFGAGGSSDPGRMGRGRLARARRAPSAAGQSARADHRHRRRLTRRRPRRPLRRAQHRRRVRRRGRRAGRRHARPRRPGGGARCACLPRPLEERRARRRGRRLDGEDLDEGHPRRALQRRRAHDLGRREPEQRDRPPAHRLPARAGDGDPRHRDGHARARPDRGALRDRPAAPRARHLDRPRAPRARRHRRARRRGERRGDRRAAAGRHRRRAGATSPELEPHLRRTDIEIRRFDRADRRRSRARVALPARAAATSR